MQTPKRPHGDHATLILHESAYVVDFPISEFSNLSALVASSIFAILETVISSTTASAKQAANP